MTSTLQKSAPLVFGLLLALATAAGAEGNVDFRELLTVSFQGQEIGTTEAIDTKLADGWRLERTTALVLERGGKKSNLDSRTVEILGPDFAPRSYRFVRSDPSGNFQVDARVDGETLRLATTQAGATVNSTLPFPKGTTFSLALEIEMRKQLKAGLAMKRKAVLEEMSAPIELDVTVAADGDTFLVKSRFSNIETKSTLDKAGRTLLQDTASMGMLAYPPGHAPASMVSGKSADLFAVSTWTTRKVTPPVSRVVYRIRAQNPAEFDVPTDARQRVLKRGGDAIDIEVRAGVSQAGALSDKERAHLLSETPYEAVNDPRIKTAAADAVKGAKSKVEELQMLVAFVFGYIDNKALDRGYAPAVSTLQTRTGDCTEHSVLFSALARARGIPTRIVDGVVVDGTHAGYHEWVEVYVDGQGFVAADPTFGAFPAGPERLKLAVGTTSPEEHLSLSLAAARLLRGVSLEVIDVTP